MKTVRNVPDLYIQVGSSYKKCIKHIQNFFIRVKTKLSPVEFVFKKIPGPISLNGLRGRA